MDSFIKFTDKKIKLGTKSVNSVSDDMFQKIITSIDCHEGGVKISFEKLTAEVFNKLTSCFENPVPIGNESYIVNISGDITIYYTSRITKLYALYAVKRHYTADGISCGVIYNTPKAEFRGFRAYIPGKKKIEEFKELIDMIIAFGYNTLMLEIGGAMEYKRHPEINEGWVKYCEIVEEFNGKPTYVTRSWKYPKNAVHSGNGEGEYLTYEELKTIVDYCSARGVEIIPEVPTFCHVDYLLFNHRELAECPDEPLPNNACPSNEDYYKLIFDVLDEVIEVFKPKRINICHDEAYVYGQCPECKDKSGAELFGGHIVRLHDYLAKQGVKTMLWGDGIIPTWHGGNAAYHYPKPWDGKRLVTLEGKTYKVRDYVCNSAEEWEQTKKENPGIYGWYVPEKYKCMEFLPKDIEAINWSWSTGEKSDNEYIKNGIYNVFGNFEAIGMKGFDKRIQNGVSGMMYSHWARNDFDTLQRTGGLFYMAYNSLACWSWSYDESKIADNVHFVSDAIYRYVNYNTLNKKHLEITHSTPDIIEHKSFLIHKIFREDFRIGYYEIVYTDDTTDIIPIYWGHNIGLANPGYENQEVSDEEGGYYNLYAFEAIGTCKTREYDGKIFYTLSVPVEKDIKLVKPYMTSDYNIEFKDAVVVNK